MEEKKIICVVGLILMPVCDGIFLLCMSLLVRGEEVTTLWFLSSFYETQVVSVCSLLSFEDQFW